MLRKHVEAAGRASAAVLLCATLAACDVTIGTSDITVEEEKRFTVAGRVSLDVSTFDGSIEVRGWERKEVLVEVVKRGRDQAIVDKIDVSATQKGDTIKIDVPRPALAEPINWGNSLSASLVITAPVESTLVARSGDGSITLKRLSGNIDVRTDDGSIRISEVTGELTARTGDGTIRAEEFEGAADIETGDGSVGIDGVLRRLRLDTQDGSVQVKLRAGSAMESDWSLTTGDGSMRIELPEGFNAELDAASGDGRVVIDEVRSTGTKAEKQEQADKADQTEEERAERRRRSARLTLGSGGKMLMLRSGDGTITVRRW